MNREVTTPWAMACGHDFPVARDIQAEQRTDDRAYDADPEEDPQVTAVAARKGHACLWRDSARMKVAWSTLPPEQTTATARPLTGELAGERGGQSHGAARLDHQLELAEGHLHGVEHLVVGRRPGPDRGPSAASGKVTSPGVGASSASQIEPRELVVAFLACRWPASARDRRSRPARRHARRVRAEALDGERDAGRQAAAGAGCGDGIERDAERLGLLDDLQPRRALAGQNPGMVVGRHDGGAGLAGDAERRSPRGCP